VAYKPNVANKGLTGWPCMHFGRAWFQVSLS